MDTNSASTNRLKIVVGTITFEIEGTEALVREGMTYAKEDILTEDIREAVKQLPTEEEKPTEKKTPETISLREYYDQKNPSNEMGRVVVLTNYAEEYRNMAEVSQSELRPLFNEVGAKLPKNLAQAMRNAARKISAYLEHTGTKGHYRITNAGINLVNLELPKTKSRSAG